MRLLLASVGLVLLVGAPVLAIDPFLDVDDALAALKSGKPVQAKLSKALALESAQRATETDDPNELRNLVKLAKIGKVYSELASALMTRAEADPHDLVAYRYLLKLRQEIVAAAASERSEWISTLEEAIDDPQTKGRVPRGPLLLLARQGSPDLVLSRLSEWTEEADPPPHAVVFLSELARSSHPLELLEPFSNLDLSAYPRLEEKQGTALRSLVSRNRSVAEHALELLEKDRGDRSLLLGALGSVPYKLRERARTVILKVLGEESEELPLRRAIVAASLLKATKGLPRIMDLALDTTQANAVREAALKALPKLMGQLHDEGDSDSDTHVHEEKKLLVRNASLKEQCTELVREILLSERGVVLAAAIGVGKRLRLTDALTPQTVRAMVMDQDEEASARAAAIYAIPFACPYDAAHVDLLLNLMQDERVKVAAHITLKQFARVNIPLRRDQWKAWRARQTLENPQDRSDPEFYSPPVGWHKPWREE